VILSKKKIHNEVKKMPHKDDNNVFVGRRPTMNYVMATMMILNKGEDCTVKARGRAISHAVDVCEILKNRFLKGVEYKDIVISTEVLTGENNQSSNVSSIEIVLSPPK
jgi:DNA-binding protein